MGYDRQRSPFATRLFLTCYSLFLLLNLLLYSNNFSSMKSENELKMIFLCLISLIFFSMTFYGLWFANILILCFIALLYSIFLGITFLTILFLLTNYFSNENIFYFFHNYLWLIKSSTKFLSIISLSISSLVNLVALWCIYHLCSCIEHRHEYWPYQKRTSSRIPENLILNYSKIENVNKQNNKEDN